MKKIILFGAGYFGEAAYDKLRKAGEILFYADNNQNKVGTRLHDIEIIDISRETLI